MNIRRKATSSEYIHLKTVISMTVSLMGQDHLIS